MAEPSPLTGSKPLITDSDMEAAQHLIQLSEDSSSDNIAGNKRNKSCDGEEVQQRPSVKTARKKSLEIFGEDEVSQPKKRKRYRSLVSIYMATVPVSLFQR
ncbi:hypothetical protein DEO72_LG11g2296 [Vigna unguiculata]|uniref:Uncharacterized protein n=2 Tax=Vigna unguiculata TaxID=3917 RepID=A0A4D6NU45_VIGUN|nr:hypothetical protein DEO72_LG11g2296 [Vigna unguiculata]